MSNEDLDLEASCERNWYSPKNAGTNNFDFGIRNTAWLERLGVIT